MTSEREKELRAIASDPDPGGGMLELFQEIDRLRSDEKIVDWIADERLFDGFGGIDIDDVCSQMLPWDGRDEELVWKETWRKALRQVITDLMEKESNG